MSILILEITEKHLVLLKHLRWSINSKGFILGIEEEIDPAPFGENTIYEAMDLILNGKTSDFNPDNSEEKRYSVEQRAEWDKLYSELPMALEIVLNNGNFSLGKYKTKYHDRQWKKLN